MAFCTNCGKPVQDLNKFCASCGAPLQPPVTVQNPAPPVFQNMPPPAPMYQSVPPPAPVYQNPAPVYAAETIRCIMPNISISKSWGRSDDYTLMVTERRSIFAKITQAIINEAVTDVRANAAAEGKGFFGKWASQMKGFNNYAVRYNKFTPDQILQETQGNFAIENNTIRRIRITDNTDDESPGVEYGIEFQTVTGTMSFKTRYDQQNNFKMAYGPAIVR